MTDPGLDYRFLTSSPGTQRNTGQAEGIAILKAQVPVSQMNLCSQLAEKSQKGLNLPPPLGPAHVDQSFNLLKTQI